MNDFEGIYVQQLVQLSHGLAPYKDFAVSYPPLFLYALYPFYLLAGANAVSIPITASDAATAVVVYLVVERLSGDRLARAAGLAYAFSPFALYYEGYVWFSSQPMTFFAVLAVYFIMRNKAVTSLSTLAIAVLLKQQAVFLLPVLLALLVHRHRRRLVASLGAFSGIVLGVSVPFLVASPRGYLTLVTYGLLGKWPGLVEPEPLTSSALCHQALVNSAGTLMSCSFGSSLYSEVVNNSIPSYLLLLDTLSYDLDVLATFVAVPMFLLLIPALYGIRKNKAIVPLMCAYSGAGMLILFPILFHTVFRYYFVPLYALLLLAATTRKAIVVAVFAPIAGLLAPSGAFQELVPLIALLVMAALLDADSQRFGERSANAHGAESRISVLWRGPLRRVVRIAHSDSWQSSDERGCDASDNCVTIPHGNWHDLLGRAES